MPDIFINESDKTPEVLPKIEPKTEAQKSVIEGHTHSPLSAFCFYPDHIDFETRAKEEKIVLLLRQHIIVNLKWILGTTVLLITPGVIKAFGLFAAFPTGFELVITLGWYLVTLAYATESFLNWFFNVYIVTDMRVIDVDFHNLIYKEVSDANLNKIQDVTYNMGGVVRTIFNYGDVFIQTAAEVSVFEFLGVPNPEKVAKIIEDLITKEAKKK